MEKLVLFIFIVVSFLTFCTCEKPETQQFETYDIEPMTGIALWANNELASSWPIQLEFAYMEYDKISKGQNEYDWTYVDNILSQIASRSHQAILRFRYTYVGEQCAVPSWIKNSNGYVETSGTVEGKTTYFPDWRSKTLQDFHLDFYRKFAQRYDHDPRIAFLQVGFGLWAEYHIYEGPFIPGQTFPSKDFQKTFLTMMDETFECLPWSISIDAADETYSPFAENSSLQSLDFGCFDDSFMCKQHDKENAINWSFFGEQRYKNNPCGGEFSYYRTYDQKHCLDQTGLYGRRFEDEARKFHLSYIIGNDQPNYQDISRFKETSAALGYRFVALETEITDGYAKIYITNEGIAPIYRDAFVSVEGIRSDYSLKGLLPGDKKWITISSPEITPESVITIECDYLVAGQTIHCYKPTKQNSL